MSEENNEGFYINVEIDTVEGAVKARQALLKLLGLDVVKAPAAEPAKIIPMKKEEPAAKEAPAEKVEKDAPPSATQVADADALDRKAVLDALTELNVIFNKSAATKTLANKLKRAQNGELDEDQYHSDKKEEPEKEEEKKEEPAKTEPKTKRTEDDVRAALQLLVGPYGREGAAAVLKISGNASKASELQPESYDAFFSVVEEVHALRAEAIKSGQSEAEATEAVLKRLKKGWK